MSNMERLYALSLYDCNRSTAQELASVRVQVLVRSELGRRVLVPIKEIGKFHTNRPSNQQRATSNWFSCCGDNDYKHSQPYVKYLISKVTNLSVVAFIFKVE